VENQTNHGINSRGHIGIRNTPTHLAQSSLRCKLLGMGSKFHARPDERDEPGEPMAATAAGSAESELDPRLAMDLSQQAAARSAALSSWVSRIDLATWGLIWLLAYGTLWITARGAAEGPPGWAFVIFFGLLAAGMVGSAIAGAKYGGQMVGPSSRAGMLYGWTWMVAFGVGMRDRKSVV
jgi:hypothetical protein